MNVDLIAVPEEIAAVLLNDPRFTWSDAKGVIGWDRPVPRRRFVLTKINHRMQHKKDCGTKYRGCAPDCTFQEDSERRNS